MDGLIFDLDGTLWDSTEEVAKSWNATLEERTSYTERVTQAELKTLFGKPLDEILESVFPDIPFSERTELGELLFYHQNEWLSHVECPTYEGMLEGIPELAQRFPVFIVSNCQKGYIEAFLENTGLGEFVTDHTCPGDTGMLKGENIQLIMKRNDLKKVAYVGDTAGDESACVKAGVPMVYAAYGFGKAENPWKTIRRFNDIFEIDFKEM